MSFRPPTHTPYDGSSKLFTIGLKPLDLGAWIEVDEYLLPYLTEKRRLYGEDYPLDEAFLAALAIMPEASGIALGLDRLAMLATGASRIDQVIWTPVE